MSRNVDVFPSDEDIGITWEKQTRDEWILQNLRLVAYIARFYKVRGIGTEDLISVGTIGLIKAIHNYKPYQDSTLTTYARTCIKNEIRMYIRKQERILSECSLDQPVELDDEGNEILLQDILTAPYDRNLELIQYDEEKDWLRRVVSSFSETEQKILELRYGIHELPECQSTMRVPPGVKKRRFKWKNKSQAEVAAILGVSQSYISRLEKNIITYLRDQMLCYYAEK